MSKLQMHAGAALPDNDRRRDNSACKGWLLLFIVRFVKSFTQNNACQFCRTLCVGVCSGAGRLKI